MFTPRRLVVVIGVSLMVTLAGCKSAQDRVVLGDDLYIQGQYAQALNQYRQARRKDPGIPDIDRKIERTQTRMYLQQGDQYVVGARFDEARQAYREVARLDPANPELPERWAGLAEAEAEWHFRKGQQYLTAGDPFSAIPEFERTVEIMPGHTRAHGALDRAIREQAEREMRAESAYQDGVQAAALGRYQEAVEHFDRALELDPNHAGASIELARAAAELVEEHLRDGDASAERRAWAEALAVYEAARALDPSSQRIHTRIHRVRRELDAEQWIERADRARQRGDWREAFESYEQARLLTSEPDRVDDRFNEAQAALVTELAASARAAEEDGRYDDALSTYRAILEVHPGHADADAWYHDLTEKLVFAETAYRDGHAALRAGNLLLARRHFRECTDTLSGYLDAAERLDAVRRDLDLAETLYNRALEAERAGRDERARILYEECLAVSRPFKDADERLEEMLFAFANDDYEPYLEGCRAQSRREYERARTLLRKCRTERPGYRDVAERLEQINAVLSQVAAVFRRAEGAAQRHDFRKARDAYAECLTISGSYRDAADRLARIEETLKLVHEAEQLERERRLTDARDHYRTLVERYPSYAAAATRLRELDQECKVLANDYTQLVERERQKDYRGALSLAVKIRNRCSRYEDVEDRISRLEIEADYADARSFEDAGRWELAGRAYERCVQRDAGFRDARERWERVRTKVGHVRGSEDDWEGDRGRGSGRGRTSGRD